MATRPNNDLRIMACVFCKEPEFQRWAAIQAGVIKCEQGAKSFILKTCGITSRNELDTSQAAAELFHQHIRRPFLEWRDANKE